MASLSVNGASLEYFDEGKGEPVVLVHGSASDYRTWESQHRELARDYRVINYSRRFHWPNQRIREGEDYSMRQQLDDLAGLLDSLQLRRAHLVGHSYGAFLCLLLAIRNPDQVRTLVLAEPPVLTLGLRNPLKFFDLVKLLLKRQKVGGHLLHFIGKGKMPATRAFKKGDDNLGAQIIGQAVFGPEGYGNFSALRRRQVNANLSNLRAEVLGSGLITLPLNQVKKVRVPTLLINGQNSIKLFHHLTDWLKELLPVSEKKIIPNANHAMHEDNPRDFNQTVLAFLSRPGNSS